MNDGRNRTNRAAVDAGTVLLLVLAWHCAAAGGNDTPGMTAFGPHPDLTAGTAAMQAGDFAAGVPLLLAGLPFAETARQRAAVHSNLCAGFARLREFERALEHCNRSLSLRRDNWRTWLNRAGVLLGLGLPRAALDAADTGLRLAPATEPLRQVREMALQRLTEPASERPAGPGRI